MLVKARERIKSEGLKNVTGLHEMDASNLEFPDASFDTVVGMYLITVVPDPEKVMRELSRVTKPGGTVMLVNHFSQEEGVRGWVERRMAPFADLVGWHSVFDMSRAATARNRIWSSAGRCVRGGIFTMLRFHKDAAAVSQQQAAE